MSKKIELKGRISEVGDIEFVGANNSPKQRIVIFIPAFKDEYGDVRGKDEYYSVDIMGPRVERHNINESWLKERVEAVIYITGNKYTKSDNSIGYAYNASLYDIKKIDAPAAVASQNSDSDLPF